MSQRVHLSFILLALFCFAALVPPSPAQQTSATAASGSSTSERACPLPGPGERQCHMLRLKVHPAGMVHASGVAASPEFTPSGYGPADLQSAYNLSALSAANGAGVTVAIVDAYDDPTAESDLGVYRSKFGLPACTTANGCFKKVNQNGNAAPLPSTDTGWAGEIALDIEMVSAVCPQCHILLVEASSANDSDLDTAVDTAALLAPKAISNSYGGSESSTDPNECNMHYSHPGIAVTASSGDDGYGVEFPAACGLVTAVGGTSLVTASNARGWAETVWGSSSGGQGAGSGCSYVELKPLWQTDTSCSKRTVADVSAVADPNTGVAIYDTTGDTGWDVAGGTSVASPLIAGIYGLARPAEASDVPAKYAYANPSAFYDVTSGSNGTCGGSYLCTAKPGYDGPTGLGTPNGIVGLEPAQGDDFSISASPNGLTLADGTSGSSQISTTVTTGNAQTVALSVSNLPSGATASFTPSSISSGQNASLSVSAGTAAPGSYTLSITGTGASATHSTPLSLIVDPSGTTTAVQSSLDPSTYGQAVSFTATVTGTGTPAGSVQFAIDGASFGSPVPLLSGSATSASTSTLTVTSGSGHVVTAVYTPSSSTFATSTGMLGGGQVVNPATSVTSVSCPASVVYSGSPQTPCTATVTGAGGLNQSVSVTYSSNLNAGTATAAASFAGDANHTASNNSTTFTISPAPLTVTAGGYSGAFDGNTHALSACVVGAGAIGVTCSNNPAGPVGPDVGSNIVTPVASGATGNYTITSINGSWSITPLSVTVTAGSYNGVYDGTVHSVTACISSYAGVSCTNSPSSVGPGVSSGSVLPTVTYVSGITADYHVTSQNGSYSITKAPASVTPNAASKVYGSANPVLTGTLAGFLPADGVSATYSRTAGETVAGSPYTITAVLSPATALANYNITYNTAAFTITKAPATVTPNPATKVYGTADPVLTGTITGFLPADGVSATYTRTSGQSVSGSPYTISATLNPATVLGNYAITYNTASFTITKATPALTWTAPAAINYGTPLSATQLDATANVPGTFAYTPSAGTILSGGTQILSVLFTPTDTVDYSTVSATTSIVVKESVVTLGVASGTQTYPTWTNFVIGPSYTGSRAPTGTVTLYDNGVAVITLALGGDGKAYYTTQPPLNAGVNNLTAFYSGDAYYPPGLSAVTTITVTPAPVNLQASCEGAYVYTETYQCQVNLSAGTSTPPTGSITYSYDGSAPISVPITSGNASFTVPGIPSAGSHTLIISYAGQGNYAAAGPLSRPFTTQPGQTQLLVAPSTYYIAHGSSLTLSGYATTPLSGVPAGNVTFYDNGVAIGTVSVGNKGTVSLPVSSISQGQHTYYGMFAGTSNYATATSGTSTVTAY